jgi:hypothetical protein
MALTLSIASMYMDLLTWSYNCTNSRQINWTNLHCFHGNIKDKKACKFAKTFLFDRYELISTDELIPQIFRILPMHRSLPVQF